MTNICEDCVCYDFDEELEAFVCTMDLDEDEMERFLKGTNTGCPFYRPAGTTKRRRNSDTFS